MIVVRKRHSLVKLGHFQFIAASVELETPGICFSSLKGQEKHTYESVLSTVAVYVQLSS